MPASRSTWYSGGVRRVAPLLLGTSSYGVPSTVRSVVPISNVRRGAHGGYSATPSGPGPQWPGRHRRPLRVDQREAPYRPHVPAWRAHVGCTGPRGGGTDGPRLEPQAVLPGARRSTKLEVVEYYSARRRRRCCARCVTGRPRWSGGPGESSRVQRWHPRRRQRRRVLPEAGRPQGLPDWVRTAPITFPSGRHADEICPHEIATSPGRPSMGTITFHPWPVRSTATSTTPTSCASTSTRSRVRTSPTR